MHRYPFDAFINMRVINEKPFKLILYIFLFKNHESGEDFFSYDDDLSRTYHKHTFRVRSIRLIPLI